MVHFSRIVSLTNRTMGTWIVYWTEMFLLRQRGGDHPVTEVQPAEPALTATSFSGADRSPRDFGNRFRENPNHETKQIKGCFHRNCRCGVLHGAFASNSFRRNY